MNPFFMLISLSSRFLTSCKTESLAVRTIGDDSNHHAATHVLLQLSKSTGRLLCVPVASSQRNFRRLIRHLKGLPPPSMTCTWVFQVEIVIGEKVYDGQFDNKRCVESSWTNILSVSEYTSAKDHFDITRLWIPDPRLGSRLTDR